MAECCLDSSQSQFLLLQDIRLFNKLSKRRFEQIGNSSSMWLLPESDTRSTCLFDSRGLKIWNICQLQKLVLLEKESLKTTCWCQPMLPFGIEKRHLLFLICNSLCGCYYKKTLAGKIWHAEIHLMKKSLFYLFRTFQGIHIKWIPKKDNGIFRLVFQYFILEILCYTCFLHIQAAPQACIQIRIALFDSVQGSRRNVTWLIGVDKDKIDILFVTGPHMLCRQVRLSSRRLNTNTSTTIYI